MQSYSNRKSISQDDKINKRGEEYNRAVVTVQQNRKELELSQSMMQSMMMQQQVQMGKQELIDLAAKIDLQQKMLDNKISAIAPPLPQELPQMPNGGLPSMPSDGQPYSDQPYPDKSMVIPEDPYGAGDPNGGQLAMSPQPMKQGLPTGQSGMPRFM